MPFLKPAGYPHCPAVLSPPEGGPSGRAVAVQSVLATAYKNLYKRASRSQSHSPDRCPVTGLEPLRQPWACASRLPGVTDCQVVIRHGCVNEQFLETNGGEKALLSLKHYNPTHFVCLTLKNKKAPGNRGTDVSVSMPQTRHRSEQAGDSQEAPFSAR